MKIFYTKKIVTCIRKGYRYNGCDARREVNAVRELVLVSTLAPLITKGQWGIRCG